MLKTNSTLISGLIRGRGRVTRMRKPKRTILAITLIITVWLLSGCNTLGALFNDEKPTVDDAIGTLLHSNNYSSEYISNVDLMAYEHRVVRNEKIVNTVFHFPYKLKSEFIKVNTGREEIVGMNKYQIQNKGDIIQKFKYFIDDGSFELEESVYGIMNYEWFTIQIRNGLIAEEYTGQEIVDKIKVEKYKITVDPYPFIIFLGLPLDGEDEVINIYLEEYKECTGYAYIDTETNCISKLEFDLAEKSELSDKINQRIEKETDEAWRYTMPEFDELYVSISFYDINDDSDECAAIEKEIDDIMDAG